MSEQDNVFPFGKFESTIGGQPDDRIMAVINGIQHNMLMILKQVGELEQRIIQLENKNVE